MIVSKGFDQLLFSHKIVICDWCFCFANGRSPTDASTYPIKNNKLFVNVYQYAVIKAKNGRYFTIPAAYLIIRGLFSSLKEAYLAFNKPQNQQDENKRNRPRN